MKDISLYGHLTIDTILDGYSEVKTLGSMANVWKSLIELDPKLKIGLSPIDIGQALIYVDKQSSQRYSKANLNLFSYKEKLFESKVHHLLYLNEMSNCDFIQNLQGIVSADICSGKPIDKNLLKFIDYLFISDEDIDNYFDSYIKNIKGWVILHSSSGSIASNGEQELVYKLPDTSILKNINVLGAGDIFASCFLYKSLSNEGDIYDWIKFSHLKTTEIIGKLV